MFKILNHTFNTYDSIELENLKTENNNLCETLKLNKNKIDVQKKWDIAKKYANEYEFVFSFSNDGVADIIPLSRSYFKLIEMLQDNEILKLNNSSPLEVACLCEGPGGFIQAINDVCDTYQILLNTINCITLISNDKKVPNWKLNTVKNYRISYGEDGSGNIYYIKNINNFIKTVGEESVDLVTADGGFDFSNDFNSQETNFMLLLLCEIYICLKIQAYNGTFVVKVFDLFHKNTLNLISLLRLFYKEIVIQKPKTSRPANSEKYLICKEFKSNTNKLQIFKFISNKITNGDYEIDEVIEKNILYDTYIQIVKYNKTFVKNQIEYIDKTIEVINTNSFNKKKNLGACIDWCHKYNIPVKQTILSLMV